MDRAQRVDEKNGVICLVIMFTTGVMTIKMSKMVHFLYFLLMLVKTQSQFGNRYPFSTYNMICSQFAPSLALILWTMKIKN